MIALHMKDGWTSLMRAAYHGRADCVRALVNRGADVNHYNNVGRTSLMYASGIGNAECVKVLLDGSAQTNLKEECEKTALVFALHYGHIDCVKVLLDVKTHHHIDAGSDLYQERLMEASRNGTLEKAIKSIQAEMNCDKDWYLARIRDYLADHACSGLPLAGLLKPHPLKDTLVCSKGRCPLPLSGLITWNKWEVPF
eukprot:Em0007g655a